MRLVKILIGIVLVVGFGWTIPQSEETIGNLKFKLPAGWTKRPYRNEIELKPGDVHPSESCTVTIKSGLQANGDLVQWLNKQADEFLRGRQVLMNTAIPYQDDPKGWEGCGLSFAVRVNANTPTYYHMFIGFRRGGVAGTMHFVTDKLEYTQKYQQPIGLISGSLAPVNGFGASGNTGNPPPSIPTGGLSNPTGPPSNPSGPPNVINNPGMGPGPSAASSPKLYFPDSLPAPAAVPQGSVDAAAASLAKRILKGGQDGLAALERAVLMCGFSIHEMPGQAPIATAQNPNGMSFADVDLIGANALMDWGASYDLAGLDVAFRCVKNFENVDFIPLWKKSVESAASSSKPNDKFFAALLKALGRESSGKFADFTTLDGAGKLCPAQLFLLDWRSVGHIVAATKEELATHGGPSVESQGAQADAVSNLTNAVDSFGNIDWDNAVRELAKGKNARARNDYLLAIARLQISLADLTCHFIGLDGNNPLVRSKVRGQAGEDRVVSMQVSRTSLSTSRAWKKYIEAAEALGYSLKTTIAEEEINVDFNCPKDGAIQRVPGKPIVRGKDDLSNIFLLNIQGSPQKRMLSANPEPEMKTGQLDVSIRLLPKPKSGRIASAEQDVINNVASSTKWMQVSKETHWEVPVKDWQSYGWRGMLTTTITGAGTWQKGKSSCRWNIGRDYEVSGVFDKPRKTMDVSHRPLPPGGHTDYPADPLQGKAKIDDFYFYKGPIKNCIGDVLGEATITITWKSRAPSERPQFVDLQQKPGIEFDPSSITYGIQFMTGQPYVPVVKTTTTTIKGKTKKEIAFLRMGLWSGISVADEDNYKGRTVLDQKVKEEDRLHDSVASDFPYKGPELRMEGRASISLGWDLTQGGEEESPLERLASWGLRFLALKQLVHSAPLRGTDMDAEPSYKDLEEIATCAETKAAVQGQLRHTSDRSRPGRYRSSR